MSDAYDAWLSRKNKNTGYSEYLIRIEELYRENEALRAVIQRYLDSEPTSGPSRCFCIPGHRSETDNRWVDAYQCIPCQMREALAMND